MIARATAIEDAPYYLCMDGNVSIATSDVLRDAVASGKIVNIWADRNPDNPDQPTFQFGGITEPIVAGQSGSSTIDFAFANNTGNALVSNIELKWDEAVLLGLDHVPMGITINATAAAASQCVASSVDHIDVAGLSKLDPITCNLLYNTVQGICHDFHMDICLDDENIAHQSWSAISETFLHVWSLASTDNGIDWETAYSAATDIC